ncbi:MAG: isoleucine--tRNA ligase [Deltaproteobacteria bacterium]|nr:isoleucine--tRNA ligase [Deltaproteobacteria bacterium]
MQSLNPVKSDVHFPSLEEAILKHWKENKLIEKGLEANQGKKPFVFYDGPPFATGLPHYGHILAGTLKDIVPRYWVMKGRYVQRRWGWDCHGLPVEFEVENELGLAGHREVEKYGVAKFNEACRGIVMRYTKEWEEIITRTGRWVDFENKYRTMDTPFMETVWWVVKQLFEKGLVFEGHRVMPYSWRISTPLSNFEASLNYKEVQDPALTVRLKSSTKNRYYLAWTTTPWTLPSNLALAVNAELDYVEIKETASGEHYVLAEPRLTTYYKSESEYQIVSKLKGKDLENETYEPLFPHFSDKKREGAFRILVGEHVTATDGTGLVHTAPAFGEEDFEVCHKYNISLVDPVDHEGKFTSQMPEFAGMNIKDADKEIIKYLKAKNAVVKHETLVHNYPFCWRSDTPLIYKAISTWFVKLDPLKEKLIKNNKKTHWVPEHLRDGRFGNWLENARDWNISRNRFWGTPIPIWKSEDGEMHCVGSITELEQLTGKKITDLHKHYIDDLTFKSPKTGKLMKRIPEVLDCWFESGSMPYGQLHYPFENKERFEKTFPADFIAEGTDQTRGWFYTLSVIAAALFDKPPFQNVVVNGLVLAEDGKKMSKRLKNYPDPKHILETYGADALRAYLMSSPASHAEDLRFSEIGVKEVVRSVLLPLWNAYSFLVTYARADHWSPSQFNEKKLEHLENDLDRWVISRLQSLIKSVDEKMEVYHLYEVVPQVIAFIDDLTNWYIRLNRRRFWEEEKTADKEAAYSTLYYTILEFSKILAPILPFVTEEIYQNLRVKEKSQDSVHLCLFPELKNSRIHSDLEKQMSLIQIVVSMGRNARNTNKLKTRQPLREILVITKNPADQKTIEKYSEIILNELNIKKVSFTNDETKWVSFSAKPNAKVLGPRLGQKMKAISQKIRELTPELVDKLEREGTLEIEGEKIFPSDIVLDRQPKQEGVIQTMGGITVWLDTKLDTALIQEGQARELVNRIQKLRKDLNFEVVDRIKVVFETSVELQAAFQTHRSYIVAETLAFEFEAKSHGSWTSEQDIDGVSLKLHIEKA